MTKKTEDKPLTYTIQIKCYNCDHIGTTEFPKGTPVPSGSIECPNCGCKTATKYSGIPSLPSTWVPHKEKDISIYPINPWSGVKPQPKYPFDVSCETIPLNTDLHGNW